jgi:hypothetical protein
VQDFRISQPQSVGGITHTDDATNVSASSVNLRNRVVAGAGDPKARDCAAQRREHFRVWAQPPAAKAARCSIVWRDRRVLSGDKPGIGDAWLPGLYIYSGSMMMPDKRWVAIRYVCAVLF